MPLAKYSLKGVFCHPRTWKQVNHMLRSITKRHLWPQCGGSGRGHGGCCEHPAKTWLKLVTVGQTPRQEQDLEDRTGRTGLEEGRGVKEAGAPGGHLGGWQRHCLSVETEVWRAGNRVRQISSVLQFGTWRLMRSVKGELGGTNLDCEDDVGTTDTGN